MMGSGDVEIAGYFGARWIWAGSAVISLVFFQGVIGEVLDGVEGIAVTVAFVEVDRSQLGGQF